MGSIAIARGELSRRWPLWIAAFALGLVPAVVAQFQGHMFQQATDVAFVLLLILSWVVAFVVGMSLLGRPLHDGRLAFYFTRPIHGLSIAGGKLLGGAVFLIVMVFCMLVPLGLKDVASEGAVAELTVASAFLGVGLVVGILARSRTRWFIADAIGAALVTLVVVAMFERINDREVLIRFVTPAEAWPVIHRIRSLLNTLVVVATGALWISAMLAVAIGRTDRERVHRALSLTLWPLLLAISLVGLAISQWRLL